MRKTLITASAAIIVALGIATAFAADHGGARAEARQSDSSNVESQCDNILANSAGHSVADVAYCRGHRA